MAQLNTASLPDLIFVVLFFFMIVTHMRNDTMRVRCDVPNGVLLAKQNKKSATIHIYIGKLVGRNGNATGSPDYVQVAGRVVPVNEVVDYLRKARESMSPEDKKYVMLAIHADKKTPMGVVTAVKQAARQARIYNVCYLANEKKTAR